MLVLTILSIEPISLGVSNKLLNNLVPFKDLAILGSDKLDSIFCDKTKLCSASFNCLSTGLVIFILPPPSPPAPSLASNRASLFSARLSLRSANISRFSARFSCSSLRLSSARLRNSV